MGFRKEENEVFGEVKSIRHLRCGDSKVVLDGMIEECTHWMGVHDGKPLTLNIKADETVVSWGRCSKTVSGTVVLKSVCVHEWRLLLVSKRSKNFTFWAMKPVSGSVSEWMHKRLARFPDRRDGEEVFRAYAGRIWRTKYVDGVSYQIQDVETGHNLHHEDSGDLYVENITGAQRVEGGWYIFAPGREAETYFWPQDEEINQPCEGGGCAYSALPLSHDKVSREFKINGQVFVTCLATDIDDPVRMAIFRLNLHGVATSVGDCSQTITGNLAYIPHLGELVGWRFYSSTLEIYRWPIPR
ncbi:hypothetical protein HOI18_01200 [Candidatus Uhrbacteria bacterium]|nr:hypothetical protein [Candidatus Uhrbacteria bacterium]